MPSTARFRRAFSLATADIYPVTVDRGRTDTPTQTPTHRDETESPTHASRRLPANLNLKL